jgi:hypothetical protein
MWNVGESSLYGYGEGRDDTTSRTYAQFSLEETRYRMAASYRQNVYDFGLNKHTLDVKCFSVFQTRYPPKIFVVSHIIYLFIRKR